VPRKHFAFKQNVSGPKAICFGQIDFLPFFQKGWNPGDRISKLFLS